MTTAPVYIDIAMPAIKTIQKWMLDNYGLEITNAAVMKMSVHMLDYYDPVYAKRGTWRRLKGMDVHVFHLPDRYRKKIHSILKNKSYPTLDSATFFTSAILQRAASLPVIQKPYADRVIDMRTVRKNGHIPRFQDMLEQLQE